MTRILVPVFVLSALVVVACGEAPGPDDVPGPDAGVDAGVDVDVGDRDCPPMFYQHILPEYQLTLAPDQWAAMQDEFLHTLSQKEGCVSGATSSSWASASSQRWTCSKAAASS